LSLVIWTFIYSLIVLLIGGCVGTRTEGRTLKTIFLPGFIAAALVRGVACLLARAPIKEVNFPWRVGSPIVHGQPKVPVYGPLVFGLLPFGASMALLLGIGQALGQPLRFDVKLPEMAPDAKSLWLLLHTSAEILRAAGGAFERVDLRSANLWLFIYAAAAIHLYLAPRATEWRWLALVLGLAALALFGCEWLGVEAGFLSRGWYIRTFYENRVWDSMSLLVATAVLGLIAAAVTVGASAAIRAHRERGD
jgi:hypothetical protein